MHYSQRNCIICFCFSNELKDAGSKQKTVLVWIYGGGFAIGDATDTLYGPDFLLSQDNIVVTIQYRLGIFGFLNLNVDEYTGNMGLKDQQLALKWVFENIEYFSGNKNEILLFGESAGTYFLGSFKKNDNFINITKFITEIVLSENILNEQNMNLFQHDYRRCVGSFSNVKQGITFVF